MFRDEKLNIRERKPTGKSRIVNPKTYAKLRTRHRTKTSKPKKTLNRELKDQRHGIIYNTKLNILKIESNIRMSLIEGCC